MLRARLIAALPEGSRVVESGHRWPVEADSPRIGRVRLYARTCTPDHGGRTKGELAAQMTGFGGAGPGRRGRLELQGAVTALLGYSPPFGVWVAWQAWNHREFSNSASLQVHAGTLEEARAHGWAVAPVRSTEDPEAKSWIPEVRVAFRPSLLERYLTLQVEADQRALQGAARAAFMIAKTPGYTASTPPDGDDELLASRQSSERARVVLERLERSARFSPLVRSSFADACAVCGMQLGVVEAAHLIPVTDPESTDMKWNGLALCRNHHALFDAGAFTVDGNLVLRVNGDYIAALRASRLDHGHDGALSAYDGHAITPPNFWERDPVLRRRMINALERASAARAASVRPPRRTASRPAQRVRPERGR